MTIKIAAACSFRESDACIVVSMRARAHCRHPERKMNGGLPLSCFSGLREIATVAFLGGGNCHIPTAVFCCRRLPNWCIGAVIAALLSCERFFNAVKLPVLESIINPATALRP